MSPLERLFALELEFQRKLRSGAQGNVDVGALHTSYALQSGYEPLLRSVARVSATDLQRLAERLTLPGDTRDVLMARDALARLLGLELFEA
jgi:hypothetical protein